MWQWLSYSSQQGSNKRSPWQGRGVSLVFSQVPQVFLNRVLCLCPLGLILSKCVLQIYVRKARNKVSGTLGETTLVYDRLNRRLNKLITWNWNTFEFISTEMVLGGACRVTGLYSDRKQHGKKTGWYSHQTFSWDSDCGKECYDELILQIDVIMVFNPPKGCDCGSWSSKTMQLRYSISPT
jgi:hypothetical protein